LALLLRAAARIEAARRSDGGRLGMEAVISSDSLTMAMAHMAWWRFSAVIADGAWVACVFSSVCACLARAMADAVMASVSA
jgi:hypothetical protein